MTTDVPRTPSRRADAERNRASILAVARQELLEAGGDLSMAEIARRAGVGMATLYRNFPGKLDLLAELYRSHVDEICASAGPPDDTQTPGEVFLAWLRRFDAAGAQKGPLASLLLAESDAGSSVVTESRARVIAAGEPLCAAAQRSGEIRDDVALGEILDAIVAVSRVPPDPTSSSSMVDVVLDGLCADRP